MRRLVLTLVLGAVALGAVALTPSKADAFWFRRGYYAGYPTYYGYYPSYYGYYPAYSYPAYTYSYPAYYGTYTYPSYNSYYSGNVRYIYPSYNTFSYYSPGYALGPVRYYYP
jgi:hypothetical protein